MELIPEVDLIPLMELIPVVEPIPVIDMIPKIMIPIPTYPHCSISDSNSDSKKIWNHNTSIPDVARLFCLSSAWVLLNYVLQTIFFPVLLGSIQHCPQLTQRPGK